MLAISGKLLNFPLIVARYFRKRMPTKLCNIANYVAYFEERLAKLLRYLFSDISTLSKPGLNDKCFPEKVKNILEQLFFRGPHLCYNLSVFSPPPSPPHFHSRKSDKVWKKHKKIFFVMFFSCLKGRIHCEIFLSEHFMKYIFRVIS